jgi:methyl-accepting chemotaxis protein
MLSLKKEREMKKNLSLNFLAIILGSLFLVSIVKAEEPNYQAQKLLVQKLVNEAAELIKIKGQAALDTIADKNGRFNTKDSYVFITSSETGADLVNPAFQEIEGLPAEDYTDPVTKAAQMTIVNAVKDKDTAWVEYLWPKPQQTKPSKKISYLKKIIINGKVRIIGAGFYPE